MGSSLSTLLVQLRKDGGYASCRKFAEAVVGLSRESIRSYETGRSLPSNQSLMLIFETLGVSPESDNVAKRIVIALCEERRKRDTPSKRAFGAAATEELGKYYKEISADEQKVELLLNLFFEHFGEEQDSMRHYIKRKISSILEG
jgi:transcriptional regulator with XRE-family HTH domain